MIIIKNVTLKEVDALIKPYFEEPNEELQLLIQNKVFEGKKDQLFVFPEVQDNKLKYTLYMGLGKSETFNAEVLRNSMAQAIRKVRELKVSEVGVQLCVCEKLCVGGNIKALTESILLADYSFKCVEKPEEKQPLTVYLTGVPEEKLKRAHQLLEETTYVAEGVMIARDLTNQPSNKLYPEVLAEKVKALGTEAGFEVEVMAEEQIKALGMEAFLAVGGSSEKKPRLIVMRYKGETTDEVLGLVGKGLTYDTGGYSLKPTDSMKTMHSDMGGAAAVIGAMYAMSKNKVKQSVTAVVAACENVISAGSYKPGDIIGSMAGKTIEIGNTDAEGRLTLADAVTYIIEKEKVSKVIDVATLTGAALVALGTTTTAVVTNDEAFYQDLEAASKKTQEQFWMLPSTEEYRQMNKSEVADLKNIGGRHAGTITAGLFVGEFVQDKPWLHLDIAGTAWCESAKGYLSKGGTGAPVRTLYTLVATPCPCHHH